MVSIPALDRNSLYCYILLIAVLLFQLRYIPPAWEHELLAGHTRTIFFIVVALLARGQMATLFSSTPQRIVALGGVFFFYALLTSFNSVEPGAAFARWYCYFSCWLLAWGVVLGLQTGLLQLEGIFFAVLTACIAIVVAEARDIADEWQMYRQLNRNSLWNPLYFNQIRNFAHVPFAGLLLSVWLLCKAPSSGRFYLGCLCTLMFMTVVLWPGGRAPLLVLPFSLVLFALLLPRVTFRRIALVWSISALIGFAFLNSTDNDFMLGNALQRYEQDFSRIISLVGPSWSEQGEVIRSKDITHMGSGRLQHWRNGLSLWQQHPLLGNGGDAFLVESNFVTLHPHNWVVRILLEFGIIGLGLVLALLVGLLWPAITAIRRSPESQLEFSVATVLVLAWLFYGSLSGTLYFSWSIALFSVMAGVVAWAAHGVRADVDSAALNDDSPARFWDTASRTPGPN